MNNLRKLRLDKRMTIRDLEEATNIAHGTISMIENGNRPFTQEHIEILTKFFGCTSDYLLGIEKLDSDILFALYKGDANFSDEDVDCIKKFAEFIKTSNK